jgi:hypothetical protein
MQSDFIRSIEFLDSKESKGFGENIPPLTRDGQIPVMCEALRSLSSANNPLKNLSILDNV